jgi:hypothetical protein
MASMNVLVQGDITPSATTVVNYDLQTAEDIDKNTEDRDQVGDERTAEQAANLQRIQAQAAAGAEQREYQQQLLDNQYADFLRQRDYPMEQLSYFSSLLRGIPVQMGSTQTSYAPPPSMVSQLAGAGTSLYGASKLLGMAQGGLATLGLHNMTKDKGQK